MAAKDRALASQLLRLADTGGLDDAVADLLRAACASLQLGRREQARLALQRAHLMATAPAPLAA